MIQLFLTPFIVIFTISKLVFELIKAIFFITMSMINYYKRQKFESEDKKMFFELFESEGYSKKEIEELYKREMLN